MCEVELRELKACELQMLKKFIEVCEKLDLKYYLIGGTLLGAVRHQGFIPWDDDIDVGMLRRDYEIFISKAQELLPEEYFVQTCFTDLEYPYNFAKMRNSNTTFLETALRNFNINHGVFIDIFPLDYYPDSRLQISLMELKKKFYTSRIKESFYYQTPLKHTVLGSLQVIASKICYPSVQKAVYAKERLYKKIKTGKKLANHGGAWGKKEIVPSEWYGKGCKLLFEGIEVTVPEKYELWLTQVYGDFMKLPPIEKQVSHHGTDRIDLKKSYKEIYN